MPGIRVPYKGWIAVCDGARALVMQNDGDHRLLSLKTLLVLDRHTPPTRELGDDRPGRVRQSASAVRSAIEAADLHSKAEAEFLAQFVERLDRAVRQHAATTLVLIAPPKVLGILRKLLTPALREILTVELAKDLAWRTTSDIEAHLVA